MTHAYDDIIELPHHQSLTRKHMPMADRAAQFAPFAALTGYDDAVDEAGRLTDREIILEESDLAILDRKLSELEEKIGEIKNIRESGGPEIEFLRFVPDEKKEGGRYVNVRAKVRRVERAERCLVLCDGTKVPLGQIVSLSLF